MNRATAARPTIRSRVPGAGVAAHLVALVLAAVPGLGFAQSGPVAAYNFNEGTGTTLTDASGNGFHGTLVNGPSWTTGQHGSALQFGATDDGNDDNDARVVLGRAINIPDLPLTLSAWVRPTGYTDWRAILSKRDSPAAADMRLDFGLSQGNGRVYVFTGSSSSTFIYAPPLNAWTHLAVVADASGTRLYADGQLKQTLAAITLGTGVSANTVIGGTGEASGGDNDPFKGKIDDLRIYNRALNVTEIQADMNAGVVTMAPETTPPTAPTGLTTTTVSGAQIDLAWTVSTDNVWVAGYRIERCQGTGCSNFVEVATSTANGAGNAGLTPLTPYSYRVRAFDPAGNLSAYSNVASATTSATAPPGPVAAYGFDEGAGTTLADSSGNGFNGTLVNGLAWTVGQHGSALQFDASDDGNDDNDPRVVLGRTINIPDEPLTISAWVNPTDYADWRAIISKRDSPLASDMRLDIGLALDSGRVYVYTATPAPGVSSTFSYAPPLNAWTHLAVVADFSGTRLYVNGQLRQTIDPITLGTSNSANTVIGGTGEASGGDNDPFKGKIDDLRIYNRALNAAEIQADMNVGVVNTPPDIMPPTAPTGLTTTTVSGAQIDLAWTVSTDNVWVAGYRIERCQGTGCSNFVEVATSTANGAGNAGLTPLTPYSYRVRAFDPAGNLSAYSNVASATTSATAPPGPVAAYGFDEGAGTTLADFSGNGFNGTLVNGPAWTVGQHGSALQFDASDDGNDDNDPRVVLGRTINIPDEPLTISAWVNPTDYADWRAIISKRDSPLASGMRLDIGLAQGTGRVYAFNGSLNTFNYAPPLGSWTHLTVVADAASTRLYVNGEFRQTIDPIALGTNASANTVIGGTGEGSGGDNDPFKGKIDDLRIYNRALNLAEIQADMITAASVTPQIFLAAPATTLATGSSTTVTVTSSVPAPSGGLVVTLSAAGTGSASFPGAVSIPAGGTSASFAFTANTPGSVVLTATAPGRMPGAIAFTIVPSLQIAAVSPSSGPVGTAVTLTGSGFSPVPANNQVVFPGINGTTVPAVVQSATVTQLTVIVPPLAESGPITVTNSNGSATSPPFTVTREQDYQLVASPASTIVPQGASSAVQLQLSSTGTKPFTGLASLSATGLPAGVTVIFAPAATLSAFQTGTATFAANATAAPGTYPVTLRADAKEAGQVFSRSASVNLVVQASTGVTGVKGRFVTPDNQGIAGIIVRADVGIQPQTVSDAAGNFLLTGLPAGPVSLKMDATPANPLYPIWPYLATLAADQINLLPDWTINPPPTADKFVPIANATQSQAITDARFPGLEITLPAGVTITGYDGVVKSRIAVEKIMPDKLPVSAPPFPMREAYQLYFGTPMGGIPSAPIPVTLPNVGEFEPGDQAEIWYFDGSPMGGTGEWKLAGLGTVSPDGKTVASNAGVGIPRFCGVCGLMSLSCPPPPAPPPPPPLPCPQCGKPVDLSTGQELASMKLMNLSGLTPSELSMKYNPVDAFNGRAGTAGSFGFGWVLNYDIVFLPFDGPQKRIVMPGSRFVNFVDDGSGAYRSSDDPTFDGAVIRQVDASLNLWELKFKDGRRWRFLPFAGITGKIRGGPPTFVTEVIDVAGNVLSISRLSNGRISSIGSPERNIVMTYGTNGFVSDLKDTANRTMRFTYTATNRLATVTDADGKVRSYTYVDDTEIPIDPVCSPQPTTGERIKTVQLPGWNVPTENFHGVSRRVLRQRSYDGREYTFAYKISGACVTHVSNPGVRCTANCPDTDSWENVQAGWRIHGGRIVGTTATSPNSGQTSFAFTAKGMTSASSNADGQTTNRKYDTANRLIERSDVLGRTWKYEYDGAGNMTRSIDPIGRIAEYTYDAKWNLFTSFTRFLPDGTPVVIQYAYDQQTGNLVSVTDALGRVETYAYTARGQNSAITMPGNRTSTFSYNDAGDLLSVTSPSGFEARVESDGAGRATATTNPLGFTSTTEYNSANQVTKLTDALGQVSRKNYDAQGRLTGVVNPLNTPIESYEYNLNNRLSRVTDALNNSTALTYDSAGRLASTTNRNGATTTFAYDVQDRLVGIIYGDGTSQTRTYDAVGRLVEVREPDNSAKFTYDEVNRVVRVVTDNAAGLNEVTYTYDTLDRVTSRTVNGTDTTTYTFDKMGRPTSMTHRGQTTSYVWNTAGLLESKVLPDGISQSFQYDAEGHVTQIQYSRTDGTVIETIAYTYDASGNRLTKSSDTSSTQETPMTATYDVANRMTSFTLTASGQTFDLAYDGNGSLLTKTERGNPSNVTTYTWNSRGKLIRIQAPGLDAVFGYDFMGRRISRTLNGQSVGYVYDGRQVIGELRSGTISTSLLTTVAIDDVVARHTSAGARTYLTDALRNVVALARDDQNIQAHYSYTPYGETAVLGDDEGNPIQYTGRENDQTGLYFYRARYYDPILKRFVNQDPIGLAGGQNMYAYVEGDPVGATDPSGLTLRAWWIQLPTPGLDGLSDIDVTPVDVKIEGPLNVVFFYVTGRLKAHVDFVVGCEETDECGGSSTWTVNGHIPFSVPVRWPVKINLIGTFLGFKYRLAGSIAWALIQIAIYTPDAIEFYNKYKELMTAAALLAEQLASQDPTVFCGGGD